MGWTGRLVNLNYHLFTRLVKTSYLKLLSKKFGVMKKSCYFCSVLSECWEPCGKDDYRSTIRFGVIIGGLDTYILKAFSERFGFDALRISQIQTSGQKPKQRERPLRCNYCTHLDGGLWYIYIGVGLSALLGTTTRAMREPSKRGPGTELAPRFLCVC